MKILMENYIIKKEYGSLCLLFDTIMYVIDYNGDDNRDE